jgi:hypothetical protein
VRGMRKLTDPNQVSRPLRSRRRGAEIENSAPLRLGARILPWDKYDGVRPEWREAFGAAAPSPQSDQTPRAARLHHQKTEMRPT